MNKVTINQDIAVLLIKAIRFMELGCLEENTEGKHEVSPENMETLGVTFEDMRNLQQLRIKMEKKLEKDGKATTATAT